MTLVLVLGLVAAILLGSISLPAFVGGAWSPTRRRVVRKMLQYASLQPGDVVVDLGAGDGRVMIEAVRVPGVRAVGIEIDPIRYLLCKTRLRWKRVDSEAVVLKGNFFHTDLSSADVVMFYLSQAAADKLRTKLERELKAGSRVVSYRRPVPGWHPIVYDQADDIYVYEMKGTRRQDAC